MSLIAWGATAASVAVAAFIQGAIGVGFALIMAPVLAVTAPALLPGALLILMIPLNAYVAWRERTAIDRRGAAWVTLGRLVGTAPGGLVLTLLSPAALNAFIGATTIAAALATKFAPAFKPSAPTFVAAGLITGVTETATGVGGPPLALIYQHHAAATLRATIALCFLVGEIVSLVYLAFDARLGADHVLAAAYLAPFLAAGVVLSRLAHQRMDDALLRTFLLAFSIISGAFLIVRSL